MNSTNIKVISEEIQRLKDQVHAIDVEVPDPSDATDGQILSVDDGKYVISDPEIPAVTAASTGDVLGLVGEAKTPGWITPYTPLDYSTTEQDTGVKWIDGKEIFRVVINGQLGVIESTSIVILGNIATNISIIDMSCVLTTTDTLYDYKLGAHLIYKKSDGSISQNSVSTAFSEGFYKCVVYYTKTAPTRDDDTNPEPTATKKKTTKKGE